jgi:hypothetical protein
MYVHTYVRMYICTDILTYVRTYIYIYIYIYTYTFHGSNVCPVMVEYHETCQANIDCITQLCHQSQIDNNRYHKIQSQSRQTSTICNTLSI